MTKFEYTSLDSLKFNKVILDYLIHKVFDHKEVFLSSESRVKDLRPIMRSEDYCTKINDKEWECTRTKVDIKSIQRDYGKNSISDVPKDKRKQYLIPTTITVPDKDICKNKDILNKIYEIFEVKLTSQSLKNKVTELAFEISSLLSPEKRKQLETQHYKLFED